MTWGQFLDHDITLALGTGINCELDTKDPECVNIEIPEDDDVFRKREVTFIEVERDSPFKPPHYCSLRPREHVNRLTAFIDGSQIYGSEEELTENLKGNGGTLRDMKHPHGCPFKNLLPRQDPDVFCVSKDPNRPCFLSGDERTNENQGMRRKKGAYLNKETSSKGTDLFIQKDPTSRSVSLNSEKDAHFSQFVVIISVSGLVDWSVSPAVSQSVSQSVSQTDSQTKGLRSKRQLSKLFTVANSHYQLS